jgi:WD40 repeat protein
MSAPLDCPRTECWAALLDAGLPPERREGYERHLESCHHCQDRLDRAGEGGDPLRLLGRELGDPTRAPADPALVQVLERLREGTAPPEPPDLYFLGPADRPGVLGILGGYEVREVLGQGGMGVVLKAYDPALHRLVAIKVMGPAVAGSATARRRFIREAQAAAAVCHEHVVAVHGVHEADGLPYLVMQYVRGESLQQRLDRAGPLPAQEVVRIGLQTAQGLAAAHARGLIHRDVKPANLLLEGDLAKVKVTDFGLARTADDVGLTQAGVVAGTPEYMPPEQARGEAVDHRADLFGLGAALYACCTGRPPFRAATPLAVLRQVNDQAPVPLRQLNPDMPAWLEALIARLMAKAPADRLPSAAAVALLLEGFLAHVRQPATVPAPELPPPGDTGLDRPAGDSGGGTVRRLPQGFLLAALVLPAVLGVGLFAVGVLDAAGRMFAGAPAPGPAEAAAPVRRLAGHTGPVHDVRFTPNGRLVSGSGWKEGDHTVRVWDPAAGRELLRIPTPGGVRCLDVSPDGRFALAGLSNGPVLDLDLETGAVVGRFPGHGRWPVTWVAFAPDGRHAFSGSEDGTARLWNLDDGKEVRRVRAQGKWVIAGAPFPDGRRLLTADDGGVLQLWDVETGQEIKRLELGHVWVSALTLMPDGRQTLVGTVNVSLWDLESGEKVRAFEGHEDQVHQVVLSSDGRQVLTACWDGKVRLWDFATGELLRVVGSHDEFVFSAGFAPDGRVVASGGGGRREGNDFLPGTDHDIRLWDVTAVPADAPPPHRAGGRGWLVVGVALGLVLASTIGLWLFVRARRRAAGALPGAPGLGGAVRGGAAAPSVSFPCPGCGKDLRARPELAGRKVKCPGCRQPALVPDGGAGTAPG